MKQLSIAIIILSSFNLVLGQGFAVKGTAPSSEKPIEGKTLETREANNTSQKPAFAGQTRAVAVITKSNYKTTTVTDKLFQPWSISFMPNGKVLVSETSGNIRIVTTEG
ncbi:MAG: hypothetical protein R2822_13260 [Spirosomataceae bacterium]